MKILSIYTQLVPSGERRESRIGIPVFTLIYPNSAPTSGWIGEMDKVFSIEVLNYNYSRYGNIVADIE